MNDNFQNESENDQKDPWNTYRSTENDDVSGQQSFYNENQNESSAYYYTSPNQSNDSSNPVAVSKKSAGGTKLILGIVCSLTALIAIAFGVYGIFYMFGSPSQSPFKLNGDANPNGPTVQLIDRTENEQNKTAQEIYKKCNNFIVTLQVTEAGADLFAGATSGGSGIIISKDGYIVTNSHVVGNKKQNQVKVILSDGSEYDAEIKGFDTRTDLAVIKIINANNLPVAEFSNSDQVEVGEGILVLGTPLSPEFSNSLTKGIVSAKNRSIISANSHGGLVNYIQIDAPSNPGNSGGAVLDMSGKVIGISTIKIAIKNVEGMSFAIPSNTVKEVIDSLIKQGYVTNRAALGISYSRPAITEVESQHYNVPQGVIISGITNADLISKGVKNNDIITKIDNFAITSADALYSEISKHTIGDKVKLTIYRINNLNNILNSGGSTFEVTVSLIEDKGSEAESLKPKE